MFDVVNNDIHCMDLGKILAPVEETFSFHEVRSRVSHMRRKAKVRLSGSVATHTSETPPRLINS